MTSQHAVPDPGQYWLIKAEPDSRVVKGKDVKFSIDDFESAGCTPWEGVRNYEARNLMREMALGDKILFYHSNCKHPGIAGFAEVSREAYPDHTAWDSTHPYFDPKSDKDNPRWFMVDARFVARARHFVPLSLLRHLAELAVTELPEAVSYVGRDGIDVIKAMPLITRGRLSVQRVSAACWNVIHMMADKGGWNDMSFGKPAKRKREVSPPRTSLRQPTTQHAGWAQRAQASHRHNHHRYMSFLALIVKPLAYISLPVLLFRSIAHTSPVGRYYWRVSIFLGSLAVVSAWGIVVAVGMTLVGRRHDVNHVVARTFYNLVSHALELRVEVEGEEYLQTRPAVMVGNHQSMLDVLYLARMFPRKASIMAKRELQWTPLGPWMYMSGAIFIDRGNSAKAHSSLEAAGEEMKREGISLMMYPEGTRHIEQVPSLLPFKKGAFHLAVQAGLPITPVVCENYWRLYHKGVFGTGVIKVRVLPPTHTTGLTVADVTDLATRVREQMLATLRDISVKVDNEDNIPEDVSESTPEPPPSTGVSFGPVTVDDVVPSIPATPSEETPSEISEPCRSIQSLRPDGSVSEYGETDDEGMVHIRRPIQ